MATCSSNSKYKDNFKSQWAITAVEIIFIKVFQTNRTHLWFWRSHFIQTRLAIIRHTKYSWIEHYRIAGTLTYYIPFRLIFTNSEVDMIFHLLGWLIWRKVNWLVPHDLFVNSKWYLFHALGIILFLSYNILEKQYISRKELISVLFSCSVVSDSLRYHGLQHARPPCPSPTPAAYSNSCPLSQWCRPTMSSSVVPFSSSLQSFPASGSFPVSHFFTSGGQSIGVSASASVLPMNI